MPDWKEEIARRLRSLKLAPAREAEIVEEVAQHLEDRYQELVAGGAAEEEARRKVLQELSDEDLLARGLRLAEHEVNQEPIVPGDGGTSISFASLWQDIRYGLRMLRKNPSFTVVAVLTLALGIGANSAVFNVLDTVLLRSLPVTAPHELVLLTDPDSHGREFGNESGDRSLLSFWEFEYLRDHNDVFSGMLAADSDLPQLQVNLSSFAADGSAPEETARVRPVSGGYFSTLGVKAAAGRLFTAEVDRARGASAFAVISYAFWKQRFGLDPAILGKTIRIHQTPFEIIGATEQGFFGETVGQVPDIWVPLTMQEAIYPGRDFLTPVPGIANQYIWLQVMARLKPGVTLKQANAGINVAFKQLLQSSLGPGGSPEQRRQYLDERINLRPCARGSSTLHETFADPLKLLMALVALVLLIACANVGNLLLARGTARGREFAVRIAIGAGRSRLLRQLLVESLLLAFLGAAVGLLIALWADALLLRMVTGFALGPESIQLNLRPDARALGFTLLVSGLAAVIFALIPALRANRLDVSSALKSSLTGTTGETAHRRLPAGKLLVVAQVAVSLVLLVAAGLFVHSLARLSEVSLGYNREKLLLFRVDAAPAGYKGPAILRLHQNLLAKFSAIPGVRVATLSSNGLFQGGESQDEIEVEGYTPKPGEQPRSRMDHVGPGYFSTVGIPLLIGREIGPQDSGNGPRAAVINQPFARTYFPNQSPIGKHVRDKFPGNPGEAEIVGVVADSKVNSLRELSRPRIYFPFFNPVWEHAAVSYEVRTFADSSGVSSVLRKAVQETNSALLPIQIETMPGLVERSLGTDRLIMRLSSVFGLLAMLLASIGLYGVMAYTVARRTRDIGLRMALGARPGDVLRDILRETLLLVLLGITFGLPVALAGTRLIKSLLFGLGTVDGVVLALAVILLAIVAVLAGFLPARRASRVDPIVALRYE
jgi:predicted permease